MWKLFQFIPISVFLWYVRYEGASPSVWRVAFMLGGGVAVVETLLLFLKKVPLNRLVLAVNLFLFVGGLAFAADIGLILRVYKNLMQTSLFVSLIIVGIISTVASKSGFVGVPHPEQRIVMRFSLGLLAASVVALCLSIIFRGNMMYAGVLPFIGIILINIAMTRVLRRGHGRQHTKQKQ